MSVLVALKMLGRLEGAILTVILADVTTGEGGQDRGGSAWDIFLGLASCSKRSSAILAHKIQFCGEPRQGWAVGGLARMVGAAWQGGPSTVDLDSGHFCRFGNGLFSRRFAEKVKRILIRFSTMPDQT